MSTICDALAEVMVGVEENQDFIGENTKNTKWDISKITTDLLDRLRNAEPNAIEELKNILPNVNAISAVGFNDKNAMNSKLATSNFAKTQRQVQLAFATIMNTMKSYEDIAERDNIDSSDLRDSNGNMNVSYANVAQILARKFNNSINYKIAKGTPTQIAKMELQQGSMILDLLVQAGVINVVEDASYIYNGQLTPTLDREPKGTKSKQGKVIQLNMDYFDGDMKALQATKSYAHTIERLLTPNELILPNGEPITEVDIDASRARQAYLTKQKVKTFSMLSQGARTIHPDFIKLLQALKVGNDSAGYKSAIQANFRGINTEELLNDLFGSEMPLYLNTDTRQSDSGIARTKASNLSSVLDNLDMFIDENNEPTEFFYDYYAYRTDRSLAKQNVLNAQNDKHLSRAITTHGSVEVSLNRTDPAFQKVLGMLVDDYGIAKSDVLALLSGNIDETLNQDKYLELKSFMEVFRNPNATPDMQMKILASMQNKKDFNLVTKGKIQSMWNKLKAYGVLADMIEAVQANKSTFNMTHDVAPDASGSGLFINMLQALSNSERLKVEEMLANMGLLKDENGEYKVTISSLYNLVGNKLSPDSDVNVSASTQAMMDEIDTVKKELEFIQALTNNALDRRELAKMPVMTMGAYGQSASNAEISAAKDLAWTIIKAAQSNKNENLFNQLKERMLKGSENVTSKTGESVSSQIEKANTIAELIAIKGHQQALVKYFLGDDNIAKKLVQLTNDEVKENLYKGMNEDITNIYKAIQDLVTAGSIRAEDVKILSPQTVLDMGIDLNTITPQEYKELASKYGLPLTKRKEVLYPDGTTINREVLNLPSFMVSTTHMLDAAIQHVSLGKSLQEYKTKFNKHAGIVPVHDAVNSDPHFAVINDKNYIEATFEVNTKYDKVQALLLMAKGLGVTSLDKMDDKLNLGIESKTKVLTEMRSNINTSTFAGNGKIFGYRNTTELSPEALPKVLSLTDYNKLDKQGRLHYQQITDFFEANPELAVMYTENSDFSYESKNGKETITLNGKSNLTPNEIMTYAYHEVVHANTWDWLMNNQTDEKVEFLSTAIEQLASIEDVNPKLKLRLQYLQDIYSKNKMQGIAELIAMSEAEPEFRDSLREALEPKSRTKFQEYIDKIIAAVTSLTSKINIPMLTKFMKKHGVTPSHLFAVTSLVHEEGRLNRALNKVIPGVFGIADTNLGAGINFTNARELANDYSEYIGQKGKFDDPFASGTRVLNEFARNAIMMSLQNYGTKIFDGYLTSSHKKFYKESPIYKTITDYLNDALKNKHISQIIHYMNLDNFKDRVTRTKLLALIRGYEQDRNKVDSTMVANLDAKLKEHFDDAMLSQINDVYGKLGLFNLNQDALFMDLISGKITIDEAIDAQKLKTPKDAINLAENLAHLYLTGEVNKISIDNVKNRTSTKDANEIDKLVALYGLKESKGIDIIKEVISKAPEVHTELIVAINGIKYALEKLNGMIGAVASPIRGNVIHDIYESNYQMIPVTLEDYNAGLYNSEWTELRKPEVGKLGIMYRITDASNQPGLTTSNNFHVDGLVLSDYLSKNYPNLQTNNAVHTYSGVNQAVKIMFTNKEKEQLGIITNPAQTIYRTLSHVKFLLDTQPIRDTLVSKTFTMEVHNAKSDGSTLDGHIQNKDIEHPWFLKLDKNVAFKDLPKSVQQRYEPVTNITSLGRMAEKVTHVRTDIAPWLVGYKDIEIMERSPKLNKLAHVYKKLFTLQKIHWVIVNPVKVSKDIISNFTYLVSRNIPMMKIYSYSKDGLKGLNEINQLRNQALVHKMYVLGTTGKEQADHQAKLNTLNKKIDSHDYTFVIKNGYLSSLSTDIVLKDSVTVSGLQHDIETLINKTMRTNKGDLNSIGKFIMAGSKVGISTEDILNVIATQLNKIDAGKGSAKILASMADNLVKIKNNDDIAGYISQFIASPGSEVTKLGSASIQSIEVITKIVLHKHLKDMGMNENEAVQDVTDSLFDYTQNLPESLKVMSDYGVLLFPTFWARVQRTIYRLGRDNPVSLATAFTSAELLDLQATHIIGSNIFTKFNGGSILNSPELTIDSLFPTGLY